MYMHVNELIETAAAPTVRAASPLEQKRRKAVCGRTPAARPLTEKSRGGETVYQEALLHSKRVIEEETVMSL